MRHTLFFRFLVCVFGILLLPAPGIPAQDSSFLPRAEGPILLPQTIFVGDSGRLVVPLDRNFAGVKPFVTDTPGELPKTPDLVIYRLELERRGEHFRLFIDFIPYAPGLLSFPPLELPSGGTEPLTVSGLTVSVSSILTPSQTTLSQPVPPIAVPGTSLLVYGTTALALFLFFLGIGGSLWSRRHFRELWERFRRRHLIRTMTRFLRRLEQEGEHEKKGNPGYYLSLLSGEFREFLSLFTGVNCRSLTAGELLDLPLGYAGAAGKAEVPESAADSPFLAPSFLRDLFRTWDGLRFSGKTVDKIDLFLALKEAKNFIAALDKTEKERTLPKPIWNTAGEKNAEGRIPGEAGAAKKDAYGI